MKNHRQIGLCCIGSIVMLSGPAASQSDPGAKEPIAPWLIAARELMQVRNTHGLVFVVPEPKPPTTPDEQRRFRERAMHAATRLQDLIRRCDADRGESDGMAGWFFGYGEARGLAAAEIQSLLLTRNSDVKELLLDAVLVCASAEQVDAKPGESLVVLDPFGRRVAGGAVDLADETAFVATVRKLLHGDGRLVQRAERARRPRVARALEQLTAREPDRRRRARAELVEAIDTASAAVVAARRETEDAARRQALTEVVEEAWSKTAGEDRTRVLPFGTAWVERAGDPCPPCGMSRVPGPTRKFLDFLTR